MNARFFVTACLTTLVCFCTTGFAAKQSALAHQPTPAVNRNVAPFSNINVGGYSTLVIHVGKSQQVQINDQADKASCVLTDVNSDTLYIHQLSKKICQFDHPIRLTVNVPELSTISTQGSNTTRIDNLNNHTFLTYSSGRSHIDINGSSRSLNSILTGESSVDAHALKTGSAMVTATGNSQMQLQTTGDLYVRATGNASITYSGSPTKVTKSLSGNSSVSKN